MVVKWPTLPIIDQGPISWLLINTQIFLPTKKNMQLKVTKVKGQTKIGTGNSKKT